MKNMAKEEEQQRLKDNYKKKNKEKMPNGSKNKKWKRTEMIRKEESMNWKDS